MLIHEHNVNTHTECQSDKENVASCYVCCDGRAVCRFANMFAKHPKQHMV